MKNFLTLRSAIEAVSRLTGGYTEPLDETWRLSKRGGRLMLSCPKADQMQALIREADELGYKVTDTRKPHVKILTRKS